MLLTSMVVNQYDIKPA